MEFNKPDVQVVCLPKQNFMMLTLLRKQFEHLRRNHHEAG